MFRICCTLIIFFGVVTAVIVISLIPIYLPINAVTPSFNQDYTHFTVTYRTNLLNRNSFTTANIVALNRQLTQVFHLQTRHLAIVSHYFRPTTASSSIGRPKTFTFSDKCEDNSTLPDVLFYLQFSIKYPEGYNTHYKRQQFVKKTQSDIRFLYKQVAVTIPFTNVQTVPVQLTFCSVQLVSIPPSFPVLSPSVRYPVSCSTYSDIPLVDLLTASISSLARDLASCRYSSTDLVRWYLARIDAVNRRELYPLHAVIETNPDALIIADELDRQRQTTGPRSSLHGIPSLIKDNIASHDKMQTTAGSLALVGSQVPRDAHVVDRLRQAGAIILGKASLSEWANFRGVNASKQGWSARGGPVSSAYVANGDPLGSSSGSAVAASAGLCAGAVGTETDGSIVGPSSVASIVGLKPTVGLTSRSGVIPISHYHDSVGPMCRTVEDVALMLEIMQGVDSRDNATQQTDAIRHGDYTQFLRGVEGLRGLRLGILRQGNNMSIELEDAMNRAIELMRSYGAIIIDPVNVTDIDNPPIADDFLSLLLITFREDIANYLAELTNTTMRSLTDLFKFNLKHANEEFHPEFAPNQYLFELSINYTTFSYENQQRLLNKTRRWGGQLGIDATLSQYKLDAIIVSNVSNPMTEMAATAAYPYITVPLGYRKSNGEPYGLMITGTAWSEAMLLRVAHGFEQASHIRDQRRPSYADQG